MCCRSCSASAGVNTARGLSCISGPQLIVGELVVALEGDAVDQRVLDHAHDQRVALAAEPHVLEQAGGVERLQAAIEPVGVERVARLHQHVGEDRAGLDSLIALDLDGRDGAAVAHRGACRAAAGRQAAAAQQPAAQARNRRSSGSADTRQAAVRRGYESNASLLSGAPYQDRRGQPSGIFERRNTAAGLASGLRIGANSHRMPAFRTAGTLCEWRRQGCRQR